MTIQLGLQSLNAEQEEVSIAAANQTSITLMKYLSSKEAIYKYRTTMSFLPMKPLALCFMILLLETIRKAWVKLVSRQAPTMTINRLNQQPIQTLLQTGLEIWEQENCCLMMTNMAFGKWEAFTTQKTIAEMLEELSMSTTLAQE